MARINPFADLLPQRPAQANPFEDLRPRYARDEQRARDRLGRALVREGKQVALPDTARLSALDPLGLFVTEQDEPEGETRPAPTLNWSPLPATLEQIRQSTGFGEAPTDVEANLNETRRDFLLARRAGAVFNREPLNGVGYDPNVEEDYYFTRYGIDEVNRALERVKESFPGFEQQAGKMPRPSQRLAAARKMLYPELSAQEFAMAFDLQTRKEAGIGLGFKDPEPREMPLPEATWEAIRAGASNLLVAGPRQLAGDLLGDEEMSREASDATTGAGQALGEALEGRSTLGKGAVLAAYSAPTLAAGFGVGTAARGVAATTDVARLGRAITALRAAEAAGDAGRVAALAARVQRIAGSNWQAIAQQAGMVGGVGAGTFGQEYAGQRAEGEDIETALTVGAVNAGLETALEILPAGEVARVAGDVASGASMAAKALRVGAVEAATEAPTGFAQSIATDLAKGESVNLQQAVQATGEGALAGGISGVALGGVAAGTDAISERRARRVTPEAETINDVAAVQELRRRAGVEAPPAEPAAGMVFPRPQTTTVEGQRPAQPPEAQPAPDAAEALREQVTPPEPAAPPVRPRRGRQQAPAATAPAATPPPAEPAAAPAGAVPLPAFDPQAVRGVDDDDTEARQIAAVQARSDFARTITARRAAGPLTPETVREAQAQVADEWGVNPDILADDTTIAALTQPTEAPDVSMAGRVTDVAEPQPADGGGVGVPAGGQAAPGGVAAGLGDSGVAGAGPVAPVQPAGVAPDDGAAPVADAGGLDQPAVAPARPRRAASETNETAAPSDDALRQSRAALAAQLERGDVPPERAERLRTLIAEIDADLAGPKFSRRDIAEVPSAERVDRLVQQTISDHAARRITDSEYESRMSALTARKAELIVEADRKARNAPSRGIGEVFPGFKEIPVGTRVRATHGLTYTEPTVGVVVGSRPLTHYGETLMLPVVDFGDGKRRTVVSSNIQEVFAPRRTRQDEPKFSRRGPADDGQDGGGASGPPPRRVGINETAAWLDVAGREDAVQQPLRGDTDLGALLQAADPKLQAKPAGTAKTDIGEAQVFSIQNDTGRGAIRVYATGDKVYIDASDSGRFGTKAYQAVANWALNTGRTFIGDPRGLSDAGVIRRTEQMVSAALKAGTTQHLEPHPRQKVRDRGWMSSLPWNKGDDLGNIAGLLQTSAEQVGYFAPAVKGMDYDPATGQFSQNGQPVTDAQFAQIAANASAAFRNRPGRQVDPATGEVEVDTSNVFGPATVKRAALTFAMLRNPNSTMAGGSPQGSQIARVLYSKRAATDQTKTPEFRRWFGDSKVVDESGEPLVVYRGRKPDSGNVVRSPVPYFTSERDAAEAYAEQWHDGAMEWNGREVIAAYLSIQNPAYEADVERVAKENGIKLFFEGRPAAYLEQSPELVAALKAAGYDGVYGYDDRPDNFGEIMAWAPFSPAQVKSATGNVGTFDPNNPDIRYSRAPQAQVSVAMDNRDVRVSVEGPKGDQVSVAAGPLIDRLTKRANMIATLLDCVRK